MQKLPLGIQSFQKIIDNDYLYVDKTEYIYHLIQDASYYFLSRPRRFGKSLLLDTIQSVFSEDKAFFKNLWIYNSNFKFERHPVIRLDMSNISNKTSIELEISLLSEINEKLLNEGFQTKDQIPSDALKTLIKSLYQKYQTTVVILIDEYDKPILDHLTNLELAEENRMILKGFYGILKSMDQYLKFMMITGVSKFTKSSVFSELNSLLDITLNEKFANICGITHLEFSKYFGDYINELSNQKNFSRYLNLHDEILKWYNGYSWDGKNLVLNPFSLLSFFIQKKFSGFWFTSGTPKFLIDLIKDKPESFLNMQNLEIGEWVLESSDIQNIQIEPLLFQTGYLTIKNVFYEEDDIIYSLTVPNYEVKQALNMHILSEFTGTGDVATQNFYREIKKSFSKGNLDNIPIILRSLFSSIPYQLHINKEAYYHSIFYAIMHLLGFNINSEISTSKGRIDGVLELANKIYIMELKFYDFEEKLENSEKEAVFHKLLNQGMNQIKRIEYDKPYRSMGKQIYLVALAFLGRDDIEIMVEKKN